RRDRSLHLDVRCAIGQVALDVVVVEGRDRVPHNLHVLLQHRLLRQAEVGEGAIAIPGDDQPGHGAVANVKHGRRLRSHLVGVKPARRATGYSASEDKYTPLVELEVSVDLDAEILPGAEPLAPA